MNSTATDAIGIVALGTTPRGEVEATRLRVFFLIQVSQ